MHEPLDLSYLKKDNHPLDKNKVLDEYRKKGLPVDQLRKVMDTLYNGVPETMFWLAQIRAFYSKKKNLHREHQVYLWLVRNELTGKKLIDFFQNEEGFLNGMNTIINRIEGRKYSLERIKIDEAL
jgi:hypothetical protein